MEWSSLQNANVAEKEQLAEKQLMQNGRSIRWQFVCVVPALHASLPPFKFEFERKGVTRCCIVTIQSLPCWNYIRHTLIFAV